MEKQPIVFAYWKDGELKGFRADTFNTVSKTQPKIYTFSREQVDIVVNGVRQGCSRMGTSLAKAIADKPLLLASGGSIENNVLIEHVSNTEKTFIEWNEFELRVHPFSYGKDFYSLGEGDEWKRDKILSELEPAIEVHKFKIIDNEN